MPDLAYTNERAALYALSGLGGIDDGQYSLDSLKELAYADPRLKRIMLTQGTPDTDNVTLADNALVNASSAGVNTANRCYYYRVPKGSYCKGATVIRVVVQTQSGNLCVGIYSNAGSGVNSLPGARKSTSGSVAVAAPGEQVVPISTADVNPGDWFGFVVDNAVANFAGYTAVILGGNFARGRAAHQAGAVFPLPDPAVATVFSTNHPPIMVASQA